MPRTTSPEALNCSFCAKPHFEVTKLVAGPGVYICNECIDLCNEIVAAPGGPESGQAEAAGTTDPSAPPTVKAWEGLSDEDLLAEMVRAHAAHQNVERAVGLHVSALRERGVSWARIGEALGMTRQSAWERFSGEE